MLKIKTFISLSLVLLVILSACSAGSGSDITNEVLVPVPKPSNSNLMISISSNSGVCSRTINGPCVSVTICSPTNPTSCQTIDDILIDSGSVGLRIFSSELNSSLRNSLPAESINNQPIANCVGYGDLSVNWGPVAIANISLGNESTTKSIPILLIDASYIDNGAACLQNYNSTGQTFHLQTSPADFRYNGILGVASRVYDNVTDYFSCTNSSCSKSPTIKDNNSQLLANPIAFLPKSYESGITFKFPVIGNRGAINAVGYAVFGVGSNKDNTFESDVKIYPISNCTDVFICMPTTLEGSSIEHGFLDTGSNFFYFNDANIKKNNYGYYIPSSIITLSPINNSIPTNINIANYDIITKTRNTSFNNNGVKTDDNILDYGLPFFFGKTIYICFAGMTCNGIAGPYWAF